MTALNTSVPLRIIQLTDSHLRREAAGCLLGMNTRESLAAVIDCVKVAQPNPDLIIASGDIAQDGSVQAYEHFAERLSEFCCPSYWFAGNHDDATSLTAVAKERSAMRRAEVYGKWLLVFMNSAVQGQVYGRMQQADLQWLHDLTISHPDKFILISFHHHPIDIQSAWLDAIGLKNRCEFFAAIADSKQIKAVLFGHIHQSFDRKVDDIRYLASPSTCIQFAPLSPGFRIDNQAPGYRWLELYDDGRIETGVARAETFTFVVDAESVGY